ncbi:hypothetical protein MRX96_050088 [Rhipicephalus microplus]
MTPRGTPPYFGQCQQRAEARPEDPLPEAGRALTIPELPCDSPARIVPKPGVTTYVIDGFVIEEYLQPFSSTTTATTTSIMGAQPCYRVSSMAAPPSTMPGTDPGTSGAVTVKREPPEPLQHDSSFVETPAMIEPLPGAVTPKRKTPLLACKETGEGLQTTPSKTSSSVPGATAISKSELVNGTPPKVLSSSPRDSVASQASPALLMTPRQETTFPLHNGDNSPEKWTVDDVAEYVSGIPGCEHIAEKFRHHKIDGVALFLFKEHHLVKMMICKLGPALKLCATINSLH